VIAIAIGNYEARQAFSQKKPYQPDSLLYLLLFASSHLHNSRYNNDSSSEGGVLCTQALLQKIF